MDKKQAIAADIRSRSDQLRNLFRTYERLCSSDDPTLERARRHHLTRYLCVLTCGFLEVSVHNIYGYDVDVRLRPSLPAVQMNKLLNQVNRVHNINTKNLLLLTRVTNAPWEQSLLPVLQGRSGSSMDKVVHYRNLIAHGKNSDGLIHGDLESYFADIIALANLLHSYL